MKFKIGLRHSGDSSAIIPINYNYPLSAALYRIISNGDAGYAKFLHEKGLKNLLKVPSTLSYFIKTNVEYDVFNIRESKKHFLVCGKETRGNPNVLFVPGYFLRNS